ncbi:MAG: TadE/TadG family type IV pilus assembly protein [Beijerinckiaceae bacterium]
MAKFGGILRRFTRSERGNVIMLFGLTLPPMLGAGGMAMDYSRASNVKSQMQSEADAAALAGAIAASNTVLKKLPTNKDTLSAAAINNAQSMMNAKYASSNVSNVAVKGTWISSDRFEVVTSGKMKNTASRLIPGIPAELEFKSRAVAFVQVDPKLKAFNPKMAFLDFEAGDYNRIYVYCFDKARKNEADKGRRAETMTAISDNGGTVYNNNMPYCNTSETISYRLYNVRMMRTTPSKWDNGLAERFNHYTDTDLDVNGVANYEFKNGDRNNYGVTSEFALKPEDGLLETVLCDTLAECKPKSQGGILPQGKNRSPEREKKACEPGKFMYYGWEDRPYFHAGAPAGINGWTDRDYDDIRLVVECPGLPEFVASIKLVD